ncbi:MAG: PAS domain S-box protein, partial [Treponema sp.]|nr:PAS domain S-box protein [Treponema sp.]
MRSYAKRLSQKVEKLSKEQLIDLLEKIVDENESLNSILESLSSGLMIVDNNFILQQSNTILESRLTFKNHNEDKKTLPVWDLLEDEEIAAYFKKCAEKEITNSSDEFTTVTSGGSVRFLTITMLPFMHNNILSGRIFVIQDITESKNQEVLLHRMENLANLTNLAAGMAHEIKNPLGAISIHIQLIQKALEKARSNNDILPPKKFVEDHIDVVNDEIDHLNKLVMDFLMAVRPVKSTLELKDPVKVISPIIDFIKPEFKKDNIKVELKKPENGRRIMLDEKLFREALMNLAQNALSAIKTKIEKGFPDGTFLIE